MRRESSPADHVPLDRCEGVRLGVGCAAGDGSVADFNGIGVWNMEANRWLSMH